MSDDWDGQERRHDEIRERLGKVEYLVNTAGAQFREHKESLANLQRNMSDFKMVAVDEVRQGNATILKQMNEYEEKRVKECADCKTDISTLKTGLRYLDRWLAGLSTATAAVTAAITGWLIHKGNP